MTDRRRTKVPSTGTTTINKSSYLDPMMREFHGIAYAIHVIGIVFLATAAMLALLWLDTSAGVW